MSKKLNTTSESELESRLHSLTENLIQKQTLIESLTTEKSSLKVQLERAERSCKELEKSLQSASISTAGSTSVYLGDEGGVRQRSQVADFMLESPADPEFTRRVKRAANTIDKFRSVKRILQRELAFHCTSIMHMHIYVIKIGFL